MGGELQVGRPFLEPVEVGSETPSSCPTEPSSVPTAIVTKKKKHILKPCDGDYPILPDHLVTGPAGSAPARMCGYLATK